MEKFKLSDAIKRANEEEQKELFKLSAAASRAKLRLKQAIRKQRSFKPGASL